MLIFFSVYTGTILFIGLKVHFKFRYTHIYKKKSYIYIYEIHNKYLKVHNNIVLLSFAYNIYKNNLNNCYLKNIF